MKVVIVGGGFGGVKTALELANRPNIIVKLITQHQNFEYHGALYRSATGHSPKEVVIPLRDIFKDARNVEVVLDTAQRFNELDREVIGEMGERYSYDYLVLAMGNTINYFGIEGMDTHSHSMDTIANTLQLRESLITLFSKPSKKPARIVVIGAGASGVELSGELTHFAKLVAKKHGVNKRTLNITLIEGADRVLPLFKEKASKKAAKRLKKVGVSLQLNTRVSSCEPGLVCVKEAELHKDLNADIIVWTAGSSPSPLLQKHPYIFTLDRGRVVVDDHLRVTDQPHIYAIGDIAATPYAGMAQTALHNAVYVAADILANQTGKRHRKYTPKPPIYVVPIGHRWAIYQKGNTVRSGAYGWSVRRQADLMIFQNFEPYAQAIKLWAAGNEMVDF